MTGAQAAARLEACKAYLRVDEDADDALILLLLGAACEYLAGAGAVRETAPAQYDLICFAMVLELYDGRCGDAAEAASTPLVRAMLTQLKLRSAYGG